MVYLLQAWPRGGKDVLTTIRGEDAVEAWDETILELCLRGGKGDELGGNKRKYFTVFAYLYCSDLASLRFIRIALILP